MALGDVAAHRAQLLQRLGALDALGHDREAQALGHLDGRGHDDGVGGVLGHPGDERAVDLDPAHGQVPQVGQRRVPGPEVVERDAHAERGDGVQDGEHPLGVLGDHALGDLDLQPRGRDAVLGQQRRDVGGQVAVQQVARGEVDRHLKVQPLAVPGVELGQGLVEHRQRQRRDEAGVLGDGDELVGGQQAVDGVVPAHERLDAADVAGAQLGLRLEEDLELAEVQAVAQLAGEAQARGRVALVALVVDLDAGAPALGHVHRDVGAAHERLDVGAVVGPGRDADAGLDAERDPLDLDGGGELDEQPPRQLHGMVGGVGAPEDDGELVTAQPRDEVLGPDAAAQALGDLAEQQVAVHVPERVVDLLEVVEVEQHHGRAGVVLADGGAQRVLQPRAQHAAVRQPGERVVQRVVLELQRLARAAVDAQQGQRERGDEQEAELGGQDGQRRQGERHARRGADEDEVLAQIGADREALRERDDDGDQQGVGDEERQRRGHHGRQVAGQERRARGVRDVGQRVEHDPRRGQGDAVLRGVEPDPHERLAGPRVGGHGRQHQRQRGGRRAGVEQQGEREGGRDGQVALGAAPEDADRDELPDEREQDQHRHRGGPGVLQPPVVGHQEQAAQGRARHADGGDVEPEGAEQRGHGGRGDDGAPRRALDSGARRAHDHGAVATTS
nr:hypothetical protein [Baekduia soli]